MDIKTALMSRFKEEWRADSHRLRPLHGLMGEALATADLIAAKREEFARSGAFSEKGLTEATRTFIAGEVLPTLKNVRGHLDGVIVATAGKRASIAPQKPDPDDLIASGIRREMRHHMRTLSQGDLANLLLKDPDAMALQAVFEVPGFLSGIDKDLRNHVERAQIEATDPKKLREVEEQEEAIGLVETAFSHVLRTVKTAAGFTGDQSGFDNFMTDASGETPQRTA